MKAQIIPVTLTMKTYDMSNCDSWTKEQWAEWRGDAYEQEDTRIKMQLLDDAELYLKVHPIYHNDLTKIMYFTFHVQNRLDKPVTLTLHQWTLDGANRKLEHHTPIHLPKHSAVEKFENGILDESLFEWNETSLTFVVSHTQTKEPIRELVFHIKKHFVQVF